MKIVLGTVQFGLDYGISNKDGKVSFDEVNKILDLAKKHNITYLDTAMGYGVSEEVIGRYKKSNTGQHFKVITKIPDISLHKTSMDNMLDEALIRLSCNKVYGLLFHMASNINPKTYEQLSLLKARGKIHKLGVSVYSPEQAFFIANNFNIDLIQIPLNTFDQRFIESGCLEFLQAKGIEVHSRSLFLQGLLLQPFSEINSYFQPHFKPLKEFNDFCLSHELSALDIALSLVHSVKNVDKFVIGVCSQHQLAEILKSYGKTAGLKLDIEKFSSRAESLINPSLWKV
jgi:aryl-alcohol dehydrogenase-like predicted oxidoreductase